MLENFGESFDEFFQDDPNTKIAILVLIMLFLSTFVFGYVGTNLFSNDLTKQIITTRYERRG